MKKIKYTIILIVAFCLFGIKVDASTGICYGKEMLSSGFCKIASTLINSVALNSNQIHIRFEYKDGQIKPAVSHTYSGNVDGVQQPMFCIDGNYGAPINKMAREYSFAKPLDLESDFDRALAKVYYLYINEVAYRMSQGASSDHAFNLFFQVINFVMRTFVSKFNFQMKNDNSFAIFPGVMDDYADAVRQIEGKPTLGTKINTGSSQFDFDLVRKWYCDGIIACKDCTDLQQVINFCKNNVSNLNTREFMTFETTVEIDESIGIKSEDSGTSFTKTVPLIIKGISDYLVFKDSTNPEFVISGVKCSNPLLNCRIQDPSILNRNLLENIGTSDEFKLNVIVTGNSIDFVDRNLSESYIELDYHQYNMASPENLFFFRYNESGAHETQRFLVFTPKRLQTKNPKIRIDVPKACLVDYESTPPKYYIGGQELSADRYIEGGCCNVDPNHLSGRAFDLYQTYCEIEDKVEIVHDCRENENPESDGYHKSYVEQLDMNDLMELVRKAEKKYDDDQDKDALDKAYLKFHNNKDDVYLRRFVEPANDYCHMYTAETNDIYFPGVADSTNGEFFIFESKLNRNTFHQPKVHGQIQANFHTHVVRWFDDYIAAVNDERKFYSEWQEQLALDSAYKQLGVCYQDGTCCCPGTITAPSQTCTTYCPKFSGDTSPKFPIIAEGPFIDKDGKDFHGLSLALECDCNVNKKPDKPNPSAKYSLFKNARAKRKKLEEYKKQCEEGHNSLIDQWEYILEPELTYYYKQKVLQQPEDGRNSIVANVITEEVPMEISYESDGKYWLGISDYPTEMNLRFQVEDSEGIVRGEGEDAEVINGEKKIKYGIGAAGEAREALDFDFGYTTVNDTYVDYEQTLYYKPIYFYYSLIPDGRYVESREFHTSAPALHTGYVFNVEITNFEGEYETWQEMKSIGHLMERPRSEGEPKKVSNIQNSLNRELEEIARTTKISEDHKYDLVRDFLASKCYYENKEIIVRRDCPECDDDINFKPNYFYRTISLNNVTPNADDPARANSNWSNTEKGRATRDLIERRNSTGTPDEIYNDQSEYLEYSFILTPETMLENKKANKESGNRLYASFNLTCNDSGKECQSNFLTEMAEKSNQIRRGSTELLNNTRNNKWKYYIEGKWENGSMTSLSTNFPDIFKNGLYPEENLRFKNWP